MKKLILIILLFASCQKQKLERLSTPPEKVSTTLLNQYINYQLAVERKSLFGKPMTMTLTQKEFNAIIDNYLINDRNNLRQRVKINSMINPPHDNGGCIDSEGNIVPCGVDESGWGKPNESGGDHSVSCTGTFQDYNTVSSIIFTATLDQPQTTITSSAFAFGGVGATWSVVGSIQQDLYSGVITYKQYYQETFAIAGGLSETQLYILYGNIYDGQCTVNGMQVPKPGGE